MDTEYRSGKMEPSMRETGNSTKLAVTVSFGTLMATYSRANGLMIKPTGTEFTYIKMVPDTRENGKMISNMEKERRYGPIILCMRATTTKEKNTGEVCTSGRMDPDTKATGTRTELKELENTNGKMGGATQENGKIIICTAKEFTPGPMGGGTKASMRWIRSMATASISGLTAVSMKVTGTTASSTDRANTYFRTELAKLANGRTVKELTGSMMQMMMISLEIKTYEIIIFKF